ncbi:hypothetical protein tb265_47620 [Gemmatimonadetes bacterium T265]|nr:hypothetical protein tb265_47620 [Gemmatimonadetes bacterium T265]
MSNVRPPHTANGRAPHVRASRARTCGRGVWLTRAAAAVIWCAGPYTAAQVTTSPRCAADDEFAQLRRRVATRMFTSAARHMQASRAQHERCRTSVDTAMVVTDVATCRRALAAVDAYDPRAYSAYVPSGMSTRQGCVVRAGRQFVAFDRDLPLPVIKAVGANTAVIFDQRVSRPLATVR